MKKIVFDCDNTFGIKDCDVDDGLALIYLLGNAQADVLGMTTTYGNNRGDLVYEASQSLLGKLGREDLPLKKGGDRAGEYENEASEYLAYMARKHAGELSILATGSLTNLGGAYKLDSDFFSNVKEIVLMGGITEPLIFEKREMKELNFSCDPQATYDVLTKGKEVSVITGNNCLKVLFTKEDYRRELFDQPQNIAKFIREETDYWFGYNEEDYGIGGFYNWDVTAAVYLMHPELFTNHRRSFSFSQEDLTTGFLREDANGISVCNLPEIKEEESFKKNIYETWLDVVIK